MSIKRVFTETSVNYRDKEVCLNRDLLAKQKVSKKATRKILSLHCERIDLFYKFINETSHRKLRGLVRQLERLEYRLQEQWNFSKDKRFHCWWMHAPGCLCPKMDNSELWGTDLRITQTNCPLHGRKTK